MQRRLLRQGAIPFLRYNQNQLKKLSVCLLIATWANWGVTLAASFVGVNGLDYNHDPKNNTIAFLLQILVVLPSISGSIYWVRGFRGTDPPTELNRTSRAGPETLT